MLRVSILLLLCLVCSVSASFKEGKLNKLNTLLNNQMKDKPESRFKRRRNFKSLVNAYQKQNQLNNAEVIFPGWPPAGAMTGADGNVKLDGKPVATHSDDTPIAGPCSDPSHPNRDTPTCRQGCCHPHFGGGCFDELIEKEVCKEDSFCCDQEWDLSCASIVYTNKLGMCQPEEVALILSATSGGLIAEKDD